jgi:hypothetical protein
MLGSYRNGRRGEFQGLRVQGNDSFFMQQQCFLLAERTPIQSEAVRYFVSIIHYLALGWWFFQVFLRC